MGPLSNKDETNKKKKGLCLRANRQRNIVLSISVLQGSRNTEIKDIIPHYRRERINFHLKLVKNIQSR